MIRAAALALAVSMPAAAGVKVDRATDAAVAGIAGGLWIASEVLLKETLAPSVCSWCDLELNGFDAAVRDGLRWDEENFGKARLFSNLLAYGGVPAIMAGTSWLITRDTELLIDDAILILQAGAIAQLLNQTVKFVAGRDRPETRFLAPGILLVDPIDAHISFFSGHTNFTFATATAAVTALALRGNPRWWVAAAVGWPLALATGYFRIAADKHYATDVLTGMLVGAAVGAGVVFLHRAPDTSPAPTQLSLSLSPTGLSLRVAF